MRLNDLRPPVGQTHKIKRVGRGMGGGGRRAGRGDKGQKSRSGYSRRLGFEGGQNPLIRRLPKRGFHNIFKKEFAIVNLDSLLSVMHEAVITPELLIKKGIIHKLYKGLRVLGSGEFTGKGTIHAHHFSESAKQKIEAAGGKAELIPMPVRPETKPESKRDIARIGKPQQAPKAEVKVEKAEAKAEAKAEKPEAKAEKPEAKPEKKQKREKPQGK
jgi:large subunit ribosomal protein L15